MDQDDEKKKKKGILASLFSRKKPKARNKDIYVRDSVNADLYGSGPDLSNFASSDEVPSTTARQTATADIKSFPLLVVAFDFGTTYSGYAFAFTSKRDEIIANQAWPGSKLLSLKTPTSVLLDPKGMFHSFGYEAETMFGQLCSECRQGDWRLFRRFKMALHNNEHVSRDCMIKDIAGRPMKALPIFTMAIKYMRDNMLEALGRQDLGVNEEDIFYVLTVPAIWDESAKQFMREAALKAGIDGNRFKLSLEPEAAAIWCGKLDPTIPGSSIDWGQQYMVVDIGGGTADIAVQERRSDGSIKNLHKPSGGPWGGTYVEDNFLTTLIGIFGKQAFDSWKTENMEDYFELLMNFENKKRFIDISKGQIQTIQIPCTLFGTSDDVNGKSFKDLIATTSYVERISKGGPDKLRFDAEIVREWFDGPILQVINHLRYVLAKNDNVETIILAGGFSESKYVQDCIQQEFSDKHLVVPREAGLAVLKGAVLYGTRPNIIASRVVGCTYGMALDTVIQKDTFDAFVRIGDEVPLGKAITKSDLILTDFDFTDVQIYRSPECNPKLITEVGCEWIGTLEFPHPPLNVHNCKDRLVDVTFIFGDTELEVSVLIKSTGQTQRLRINWFKRKFTPG